ncbi:glycosyltransferase [Flectobacillus longus]|uniref:glycosyltransferase n=1 Tax=Flectobacillus longus TaxID=2984207 RepID=UPI0024B6B00F|nr:glycosyltransferase [Flectobacillus longus]MDI9880070.1 glycosyltransferase [Flectobacillus longus]
MRKTLVVDWLDLYGGAEKVIAVLYEELKFEEIWCLIDIMSQSEKNRLFGTPNVTIKQTSLRIFGKRFRFIFPLFPFFLEQIKVDSKSEIIVSSSHTATKGINKTSDSQIHICYIQQRNLMYVWEDYERKLFFKKLAFLLRPALKLIEKKDYQLAQNPDFMIANSRFVQNWLKKRYNRESYLVYPPVDIEGFQFNAIKEDYYVTVGRFAIKKRFDLIIKAFNHLGKRLIVIGDGELNTELRLMASSNIEFTGFLPSDEVAEVISKAKGFVFAALEDFGIAPVEAQACGTPVICLGQGGTAETVQHKETGYLFHEQSVVSICDAVVEFEKLVFDPYTIRKNAERFSVARFKVEIQDVINKAINNR